MLDQPLPVSIKNMSIPKNNLPVFWRDARFPYLELRVIKDGHKVCYAPHSHRQWSMGAILAGQSYYQIQKLPTEGTGMHFHQIQAGSLVFMNPDQVHACSAIDNQPWSYGMFYIDTTWLADRAYQIGLQSSPKWQSIPINLLNHSRLFKSVSELINKLLATRSTQIQTDTVSKQNDINTPSAALYLTASIEKSLNDVLQVLFSQTSDVVDSCAIAPISLVIAQVAALVDDQPQEYLPLNALSQQAGVTTTHLIRAFKRHYGLTPHAYQVNRRLQLAQQGLKQGMSIVDAALAAGFADQPHFQRVFKKVLQATPNRYRQGLML